MLIWFIAFRGLCCAISAQDSTRHAFLNAMEIGSIERGNAYELRMRGNCCYYTNFMSRFMPSMPMLLRLYIPHLQWGIAQKVLFICPWPNLAAIFCPMRQNIGARFRPRTECGSQIRSCSAVCGPLMGPNLAIRFCPRTKTGTNILS